MAMVGVSELLILLLTVGGPLNQFLGLPPGERDQNLVHAAPADSLLYIEWAARGEGKEGAAGVDGLAADPEIVRFFERLKTGIEETLARGAGERAGETVKLLPELVLSLTGQPGCLFLGLDAKIPFAEGVPPQLTIMMAARAGVVVNAGDEADAVADTIKSLIGAATRQPVDKLDHTNLPSPTPVQIHRHDNYIILGVGLGIVDEIVGRLTDNAGGIADHEGFTDGWKDLGMDRSGLVTFLDIEAGVERIGDLTGMRSQIDQGLQMAGFEGASWLMSVTGVADGQVISRGHMKGVRGDQGLMALASGRAIEGDDFALVPDDSDVVFAYSVDMRKILAAVKTFVDTMDPRGTDAFAKGYAQFGEYLGLDIEKDVFDSLDHVITVSNSPGDGGWIGTSPVLTIGIRDPGGTAKTLAKITETCRREFQNPDRENFRRRGVTLERREFMETEIFMINTIGENDVPVAPAWCLTKTHVMIALHPQALKSRLRRLAGSDWNSYAAQFDGGPDGETIAYSAINIRSVLPQIYGFMPWVGQIIFSQAQSDGFEMDLFDFPSASALLPYMTDSRSYFVRTPDGLRKHAEGPPIFGSLPSLVPSMGPMFFLTLVGVRRAPVQINAVEVEVEVDALVP